MKITCRLNGKEVRFSSYADKPVSLLLMEEGDVTGLGPGCGRGSCGNCIILLDERPVLACLVPAFRIRDREIMTFEGFEKTRFYADVTRGYEEAGAKPCSYCYRSKTLLIESIIAENSAPEPEEIIDVLSVNRCACIDQHDLITIVQSAAKFRRRRRVRRS